LESHRKPDTDGAANVHRDSNVQGFPAAAFELSKNGRAKPRNGDERNAGEAVAVELLKEIPAFSFRAAESFKSSAPRLESYTRTPAIAGCEVKRQTA